MEKLVVGEGKCSMNSIILTISRSKGFHMLLKRWQAFARSLGLDDNQIAPIDFAWNPNKSNLIDVIAEVINTWKLRWSYQATLDKLVEALVANDLDSIADHLKVSFSIPIVKKQEQTEPGKPKLEKTEPKNTESKKPEPEKTEPVDQVQFPKDRVDATPVLPEQGKSDGACMGKLSERPTYPKLWTFDPKNLIRIDITPTLMEFDDDFYRLPKINKGLACLINICQFPDPDLNRDGAIYDSYNMARLLTKLSYKVESHLDKDHDFTKIRIMTILEDFKKKCVDERVASFVVFVGSHGEYGKVCLSNGEKADLFNEIVYPMTAVPDKYPEWANIPKIFVVSACRLPASDTPNPKKIENAVVCYSCLPNEKSRRSDTHGTHYVTHFVNEVMGSACCLDFLKILDEVEDKMWKNIGLQQPNYETYGGFRDRKLYFNVES